MQHFIFKRDCSHIFIATMLLLSLSAFPLYSAADGKIKSSENEKTRSLIQKKKGAAPLPIRKGKFMFSVTLHKQKEIKSLLNRVDSLSKTMRTHGNNSKIALILHGPEIKFFAKKNYKKNKSIVDKAANLDDGNIIEFKICKSKMDEFGIKNKDIPSFVEIIPYAPDEEKRLRKKGYIYL